MRRKVSSRASPNMREPSHRPTPVGGAGHEREPDHRRGQRPAAEIAEDGDALEAAKNTMMLARTTRAAVRSRSQYSTIGGPPTCATPLKKPAIAPTVAVSVRVGVPR